MDTLGKFGEARDPLGYRLEQLLVLRFFGSLQTSLVHLQLDIRTLSMDQFLIRAHSRELLLSKFPGSTHVNLSFGSLIEKPDKCCQCRMYKDHLSQKIYIKTNNRLQA